MTSKLVSLIKETARQKNLGSIEYLLEAKKTKRNVIQVDTGSEGDAAGKAFEIHVAKHIGHILRGGSNPEEHYPEHFSDESGDTPENSLSKKRKRLVESNKLYDQASIFFERLLKNNNDIIAVGYNGDFSKYSNHRDHKINQVCKRLDVEVIINNDFLTLHKIDEVLKKEDEPYLVFGAYYRNRIKKVERPVSTPKKFVNLNNIDLSEIGIYKGYLEDLLLFDYDICCSLYKYITMNDNINYHLKTKSYDFIKYSILCLVIPHYIKTITWCTYNSCKRIRSRITCIINCSIGICM